MSVNTETTPAKGNTTVLENTAGDSVYTSLFKKINLTPASRLGDINDFLDDSALAEASTSERLTAAMQVFLNCIRQSGQNVDKLDKTLIDHRLRQLALIPADQPLSPAQSLQTEQHMKQLLARYALLRQRGPDQG